VAGTVLGALVMVGSFVYPVLVEPAFNQFTPLQHGPLRTEILQLADREHVDLHDVLVADASRRTTTLNAYVSGFGSTRRVVLYDNVVHDLPRAQILSIVAHELGHAHHNDVLVGSVLGGLGAALGVGLLGLAVAWLRDGPGGMGDPTVVPLVLALVAIATLLSSPVNSGLSRLIETRADVASLHATRDPEAFVEVQRELDLHSLSDDPPHWSHIWFGSHPTTLERIAIAEQLGRQMGVRPIRKPTR
jgi:STE24 endopeptidase